MLKSLYISSFVIIDEMQVDFHEGMSVLTGETGAGKSIIIDAIGQLCGNRSSAQLVRHGKEKAIIEGVFEIDENQEAVKAFEEIGIDFDNDIIIHKEIHANGKSTIKVNYRPVTNAALKIIAPYLIHIHSQFETQTIFSIKNHITILDRFINDDTYRNDYLDYYRHYRDLVKKIRDINEVDMSDERIEYYQSQYEELKDLEYTDEDIENLEHEAEMMKNYEKLNTHMRTFDHLVNDSHGVLEQLQNAIDELESVKDYDDFKDDYNKLYNEYYTLSDIISSLMNSYDGIDFDEYRFNEINEELFKIQRLQRKYGYSMKAIYEARDELKEKIDASLHRDEVLEELEEQKDHYYNLALNKAKQWHQQRMEYALKFESLIQQQLVDLYLDKAQFKVDFEETELSKEGIDKVVFKVSMNAGQAFTPLNESASGGEISRVMLAIKIITLNQAFVDTVIFDEVDTGVSGKVADAIGRKMEELSKNKQVICITHLPQVAVHALNHYVLNKESEDNETYTSIQQVTGENRIKEIAKLLSGDSITEEALNNARSLLGHN